MALNLKAVVSSKAVQPLLSPDGTSTDTYVVNFRLLALSDATPFLTTGFFTAGVSKEYFDAATVDQELTLVVG